MRSRSPVWGTRRIAPPQPVPVSSGNLDPGDGDPCIMAFPSACGSGGAGDDPFDGNGSGDGSADGDFDAGFLLSPCSVKSYVSSLMDVMGREVL